MGAKILHLDDDPRQTELLRLMLRREQYQVVSVNDPLQALDLALSERPAAMLLDINLPRMNGVEFAAKVKAVPELAQIPLIALTANAMYGDREYYLDHNFAAYLAKPVLRFELLRVLKTILPADDPVASPDTTPTET
jgi:CheY-like chemotaxis protein